MRVAMCCVLCVCIVIGVCFVCFEAATFYFRAEPPSSRAQNWLSSFFMALSFFVMALSFLLAEPPNSRPQKSMSSWTRLLSFFLVGSFALVRRLRVCKRSAWAVAARAARPRIGTDDFILVILCWWCEWGVVEKDYPLAVIEMSALAKVGK